MRVLIIGGAGFIGEALSEALTNQGHYTRIADRAHRNSILAKLDNAEFFPLDFTEVTPESNIFRDMDAVIHLGSTTEPVTSMSNIEYDAGTNVIPAIRLLEGCRLNNIRHFIFSSSGGTVYGEPESDVVNESHPTNPMNAYGAGKLAIEKYMRLYSRYYGIRCISLRIGNAYGPGQLRGTTVGAIAAFLRKVALNQELEVWGDGEIIRDYIYIDDIAAAFRYSLLNNSIECGEYNIGTGRGSSINELLSYIKTITGRDIEVRYRKSRAVDVARLVLDPGKFKSASGWRPTIAVPMGIQKLWSIQKAELD